MKFSNYPKNEDISQSEHDPALFNERAAEGRRNRLENILCGIALLVTLAVTFAIVQIAYGIWR